MEKQELIKKLIDAKSSSESDEAIEALKPFFYAEHPEVLDDDFEDAYDNWLNLEVEAFENLMDLKARANDDE